MRRTRGLVVGGWALVLLLGSLSVRAGAADEAPKGAATPLGLRLFDVAALTTGTLEFIGERGPYPPEPNTVNEEEQPLFGGDGEESLKPYGTAEDLIELIKSGVGEAGTWEVESCSIFASGQTLIGVRHRPEVLDAVGGFLEGLARPALVSVTVDLAAFRVVATPYDGEGGLAAAVARGALVPLAAARATGALAARMVGRSGGQQTYVADEDVLVAQDSSGPDPEVGVAQDGIAFDARPVVATASRVRLELHAWLARPGPLTTRRAVGDDPVEMLSVDGRSINAVWEGKPGVWGLLPATGDVVFAVRGAVRPAHVPARSVPSPVVAARLPPRGPLQSRVLDLADLVTRIDHERGPVIRLEPSNYTPPEPPELPEPAPAFPPDVLVEVLKTLVDPPSWAEEGASILQRGTILRLRNDAARLDAAEAAVGAIRASCTRAWRLRSDVVAVPASALPEWWSGLDDASPLLEKGCAALLARPGARSLDGVELRLLEGQRRAAAPGRTRSYVMDYDVEIAEKSMIGNPVVRSVFEGLALDVQTAPALGGAMLWCETRLDRSTWRGSRSVATRWGAIECPSLGLERAHGSFALPIGATRVVAGGLEGGDLVLFLLTATED